MTETILTLPGFEGCEKDIPKVEHLPFKYLEVEVTRTQSTVVFLKTPYDFDVTKLKRGGGKDSILANACKRTTSDLDWDDWDWESTVEYQSSKEVSEDDATCYAVYEVK